MKNISLIINAVLIAAVAFLFYKTFSSSKNNFTDSTLAEDSTSTAVITPLSTQAIASLPQGVPFAFINTDSIFSHYALAKKVKAAGEAKVANLQKAYQKKVEAFQQEYDDYVQKAGAGAYTKEQGTAIETGLQKRKEEIMMMEQSQNGIMQEIDNSTLEIQHQLYDYLKRFNKEHGYSCTFAYTLGSGGVLGVADSLDVTKQVIVGLNNEYNSGKGK